MRSNASSLAAGAIYPADLLPSRDRRCWASLIAKTTIMNVEFACPEVTNAELLAT
jgi:hypothetical protein